MAILINCVGTSIRKLYMQLCSIIESRNVPPFVLVSIFFLANGVHNIDSMYFGVNKPIMGSCLLCSMSGNFSRNLGAPKRFNCLHVSYSCGYRNGLARETFL